METANKTLLTNDQIEFIASTIVSELRNIASKHNADVEDRYRNAMDEMKLDPTNTLYKEIMDKAKEVQAFLDEYETKMKLIEDKYQDLREQVIEKHTGIWTYGNFSTPENYFEKLVRAVKHSIIKQQKEKEKINFDYYDTKRLVTSELHLLNALGRLSAKLTSKTEPVIDNLVNGYFRDFILIPGKDPSLYNSNLALENNWDEDEDEDDDDYWSDEE